MLNTLRKGARGWVAKLLLVLLVAAFGAWGISGSMFSGTGSAVVSVGETIVTPNEYRLAYNRQMATLGRQLNTQLTSEQARAFGVPERTFGAVIAGAALDEEARKMNLGLSDERLARLVADDPTFHDFNGRFDRNNFARILSSVGMSEADYIASRSKVAVRSQIVEAVADGLDAPDALLTALAQYQAESRDVAYILLTPDALDPVAEPTNAEISAFYDAQKSRYVAPEYRKITYLKLEPEDITDPEAIAEDAVRADYEANKDRYTTAETRTVDQLVFSDREAAESAAERLASGASFDTSAEEQGRSPSDLRIGSFSQEDAPSDAIGEAAFAVSAAGGTTGVVDGPFGPVILRVAAINPASVKSFEEMEAELRRQMALAEAYDQVLNVHDSIEDALAGGSSLGEAATSQRLDLVTVEAIDRTGRDPDGTVRSDLPVSRDLLQGAFEAEVGVELPPLAIGSDGFVWYQVEAVTEERQRPLDEVRETVIADWKSEQMAEALGARATELAERLKEGDSLEEIAGELGLAVEQKYALQRDGQGPVFGEAAVQAAFGGPAGHAGVASDASGANRIIFQVTAVNDASDASAEALSEAERSNFSSRIADDILDQLVADLRTRYGVEVNRTLAERAISY
ncbi:SurA N-terminal domain-containing protein [Pseudohoeflea coraliihabitans]|nr:SurA N-terminal domain-containing protein [Pseudohoeflea sp. DP4N28-3]